MIKRSGVEVMNARSKNVSIAKETIQVIKDKQYTAPSGQVIDISSAVDASLSGTVLFNLDSDLPDTDWETVKPVIEVVNETTAQAAVRLLRQGKTNIVALNFASAHNQGGGFLGGAIAQEEDLCRASGLYACLKSKPVFYNENILCDHAFYTDNVIYSPNVPFFRDMDNSFLETPFSVSIISAPAPNVHGLQHYERLEDLLEPMISIRINRILDIAAAHGHKNIILGAWGCGAFGNNPKMIAQAFKDSLEEAPAFEHVCFAVYDNREPPAIYDTFRQAYQ